uniref:ribosomal protein L35 n=1 Tax=Pseudoerythrocladia kornmannii TaxID=753682 RepID=UPI001BEF0207|nr:ribosomal protein L35 [Pseudoerythrocladia kornmannii]QUE28354.1 ribosomal protein L35 [Pseudoerythrocladia kornmannii]UNJ16858.1 ribosomal protein L35 [Pseudoerythrocladia kornmannii]
MPKLKTSKSILKRFKITNNNIVIRKQAGKSHLLEKKSTAHKQKLSKKIVITSKHNKNIISTIHCK